MTKRVEVRTIKVETKMHNETDRHRLMTYDRKVEKRK